MLDVSFYQGFCHLGTSSQTEIVEDTALDGIPLQLKLILLPFVYAQNGNIFVGIMERYKEEKNNVPSHLYNEVLSEKYQRSIYYYEKALNSLYIAF